MTLVPAADALGWLSVITCRRDGVISFCRQVQSTTTKNAQGCSEASTHYLVSILSRNHQRLKTVHLASHLCHHEYASRKVLRLLGLTTTRQEDRKIGSLEIFVGLGFTLNMSQFPPNRNLEPPQEASKLSILVRIGTRRPGSLRI